MAAELHRTLAFLTVAVALLVGIEGAWRAWRAQPRGRTSEWLEAILLVGVGLAIAGGLGLLVGGARPQDALHFVYAVLAFGAVPVASSLARRVPGRREALGVSAGALVALALIVRLFQTG